MSSKFKQVAIWVLLISSAIAFIFLFQKTQGKSASEISLDAASTRIRDKSVTEVYLKENQVELTDATGNKFFAGVSSDPVRESIIKTVSEVNAGSATPVIKLTEEPKSSGLWLSAIFSFLPFVLLIGFLAFTLRQMQAGGNKALSFGKSRAKLLNNQQKRVTFKDVSGVEEAKEELQEIIEFLKDPQKFQKLGGRIPKGVLMVGPPGTGKTLLAKAVAGEANVPFFSISGSDFVEMFVGVGASRVRDLFEQGKKNAPCIIFIDEIDAVGRHRGAGLGGGHDEREQTLNQLLVEMDGFESNEGVILVASTNRPDVLDPALLRPGRFDRRVVVGRPDIKGREGILKVHTRKIPLDADVDINVIARGTPGFTGADLANIVNEAALNAARFNKKVVGMDDFEIAKDKVMMGAERKSMVISVADKKLTAYHEAGHTLVSMIVPSSDPIHKVSIIPRGMALGITMQLPLDDKNSSTKEYLLSRIAILMGGRIAEEMFFGANQVTTGASNDIERASELARAMVCEYGMSELGPLTFGKKEEQIFLGREISQHRDYSENTAIMIDQAVRKMVSEQYDVATKVIADNKDAMIRLAEALIQFETLDAIQIKRAVAGLPVEDNSSSSDDNDPQKPEPVVNPFKKPILPPITGNNPATA